MRVKGGDGFDQPDGSNGNQIIQLLLRILVFFYHVGDQTEITFD